MNKFYNVIWNDAKQKYVVVSELVTSIKLPKVVSKVVAATTVAVVAPAVLLAAWAAVDPASTASITTKPVQYTTADGVYSEYTNTKTGVTVKDPVYINTPEYTPSANDLKLSGGGGPIVETGTWSSVLIGKGAKILQGNPSAATSSATHNTGLSYGTVVIGSNATIESSNTKDLTQVLGPAIVIGHNSHGKVVTTSALIDYATPGNTSYHNPAGGVTEVGNPKTGSKYYNTIREADGTLNPLRGSSGVTIGAYSKMQGLGVSYGPYANSGQSSAAIGAFSTADKSGAVALGSGAAATQNNAIAIGRQAAGAGANAMAMGAAASAQGAGSMALGIVSTATGEGAIAIGSGLTTKIATEDYVGRANSTKAAGAKSIALGHNANSTDTAENALALGTNAEASHKSAVTIGSDSKTAVATAEDTATVNGITYSGFKGEETIAAGGTDVWSFSVGDVGKERQIKNVAPGKIAADSTDAINGSQLYLTQQALGNLANTTARNLGGNVQVNPNGTLTAPTYTVNVANPTAGNNGNLVTTAPNVGDALANLNTYVNQGFRVLDHGAALKGTVTPGEAIQFVNGQNTVANVSTEANGVTKVTFDVNLPPANGGPTYGFKVTAGADGAGSATGTVQETAVENDGVVALKAGNNLAVKQDGKTFIYSLQPNITADSVTINNGGPVINNGGINMGNKPISNVADGQAPKDAVNKSQLDAAKVSITANADEAANATTGPITLTSTSDANGTVYNIKVTPGTLNSAPGGKITPPTGPAANNLVNAATVTNAINALGDNTIKLGAKDGSTTDAQALNKTGGLQFNITTGSNYLSTTAAGTDVTIDLSQDTKTKIENAANSGSNAANKDLSNLNPAGNTHIKNTAAWNLTANGNGADTSTIKGGDTVDIAQGDNIEITKEANKITIATAKEVSFDNVTVGPVNIDKNTGINAGDKVISNVADGVQDGDAVNVSQLKKATTKVTANDGEEAGATTGNVVLTSSEGNNGETVFDVKLNDTVTLGEGPNKVVMDGTNGTVTAGEGDKQVSMDGTTGEVKAGDVIINKDGAGTINGLTNTTWDPKNFISGQAATEDQLKALGDQFNNQLGDYGWKITSAANGGTTSGTQTEEKISKDELVTFKAGKNLDLHQDGNNFTYSLVKDIDVNSVKVGNTEPDGTASKDGVTITGPKDGQDGKVGISGANGEDAVSLSGKDGEGHIGLNGKDGASADIKVKQGDPGVNGEPGTQMTRIEYKDKDGNPHDIATLEDGMKYAGDNGQDDAAQVIKKQLNEQLDILGGADKDKLSDNNIGVNNEGGKLYVKLSKELKDLTSAEFKDGDNNVTNITPNGVTITPANPGEGKGPVSLTNEGLNNGGNTITNVAPGEADTDAVNVKQLNAAKTEVTANGGEAANATTGNIVLTSKEGDKGQTVFDVKLDDVVILGDETGPNRVILDGETGEVLAGDVSINRDGSGTVNHLKNTTWDPKAPNAVSGQGATEDQLKSLNDYVNKGWNITSAADGGTVTGTTEEAIAPEETVTFKAGKNLELAQAGNDFTYSLANDIDVNSVKVGTTDPAGNPSKDGVTITGPKDGQDGKLGISGKDGKDAVSLSSKDGVGTIGLAGPKGADGKDGASAQLQVGYGVKGLDGNDGANGESKTRIIYEKPNGDKEEVATLNDGLQFVGDDGTIIKKPLNSTLGIVGGADPTKLSDNNIGVTQKDGQMSVQLAKDIKGIDSIGGGNTSISFGDTVKVSGGDLDMGGNRITELAPGVKPTDAVNVSQLEAGVASAMNFASGEAARAGSHAGAMAALKPLQYDPLEPTQIMGGVAHYKGETAAAVGLAHFTHENTMFHVGVSVGHNENMVAGGVSHKFGWSPEKKAIPERYQGGPISSVYVMQDEVTALRAENMKQQERIEQQERTVETQQRNMEAQQRHIESQQRDIEELKQLVQTLMSR